MPAHLPAPAPEERTAIRRAARKVQLPLISGKGSVLILVLCFAAAAAGVFLAGFTLHFPMWIDFEIMLALWWVVWAIALARILYLGQRINDDFSYRPPRSWFWSRGGDIGWGTADGIGYVAWDLEGCA
jgi:hypothetical protein